MWVRVPQVNHFLVSQTNPHVVPFLNLKRRLGTAGAVAESELKHRCRQLLEVLPAWLPHTRWLKAFGQQWEGDVTIVLPHTLLQLYKAVVVPSNAGVGARGARGGACLWVGVLAYIEIRRSPPPLPLPALSCPAPDLAAP